jgi:hypothetical protein
MSSPTEKPKDLSVVSNKGDPSPWRLGDPLHRILSIDVGIKNLACCVCDIISLGEGGEKGSPDRGPRVEFRDASVLNLNDSSGKKATAIHMLPLAMGIRNRLGPYVDLWRHPRVPLTVIIENQIGPIAARMKSVQALLTQFFVMCGVPDIHYISSANKLKVWTAFIERNIERPIKKTYSARKTYSVLITHTLLYSSVRSSLLIREGAIAGDMSFASYFRGVLDMPARAKKLKKADATALGLLRGLWDDEGESAGVGENGCDFRVTPVKVTKPKTTTPLLFRLQFGDDRVRKQFGASDKKDDLADALLQAVWYALTIAN